MRRLNLDNITLESDNKKLRGRRITQIKKDLEDKDMGLKRKMLTYSSHLEWALKVFETIAKMQQAANTPGVWDKDGYSHGLCNGLIMAMAVIVEEQGDIPYVKAPKKYRNDDDQRIKEGVYGHIERLEKQISSIVKGTAKGPSGYEENDRPFEVWMNETLDIISRAPVETSSMRKIRDEINDELDKKLNL